MKAIVLTCQKYMPIAEHMIDRYDALWRDHPFVFRLPEGDASRSMAARHPGRIDVVPTDEGEQRGRFRAAVLGLLAGLDDDTWVWWCIDDKYITWVDASLASSLRDIVRSIDDPRVSGLCFTRVRQLAACGLATADRIAIRGQTFLRRPDYSQIWLHQLLRVKVLRGLFDGFPDRIESAKAMDELHKKASLPDEHRLYVLDHTAITFGESTSRGRLTANCAESLRRGRGVPSGFEIDPQSLLIGRPPGRLSRLVERLTRTFRGA